MKVQRETQLRKKSQPGRNSSAVARSGTKTTPYVNEVPTLCSFLRGEDLALATAIGFFLLLAMQVLLNFQIFADKPVANTEQFAVRLGYQNIDVPIWLATGAMLPGNAPEVRAMRPLYPAALTVGKWLGLITVPAGVYQLPPGASPGSSFYEEARAINILLGFNCIMTVVSLWVFFGLCRRFGMSAPSAAMATLVAGSGFGFSFWVTQAIPEVFGYFAVVVTIAAIVIAYENDGGGSAFSSGTAAVVREAVVWGLVGLLVGVLVLGKEVFNLFILVGLLLLFSRRWAGLVAFSVLALLPSISWNYYMSEIVGAYDPAKYIAEYRFVVWLYQDMPESWAGRAQVLWKNLESQGLSLVRAYAYVPVMLAVVGMLARRVLPKQGLVLCAFFLSFYALFLASNFIMPRLMFMTWPVIFFFAWLGIEWLAVLITKNLNSDETRSMLIRYFKVAAMLALIFLGTRQQFAWYYYG